MVRIKFYGFLIAVISLFVAMNLWFVVTPVKSAPPLSPPVRPTVRPGDGGSGGNGGGGGGAGGNGGNGDGGGPSAGGCASVSGEVINWGFGPQQGVGVELKSGSWQTATASASDGKYGLGGLGVGVAKLNMAVAPSLASELQPTVQDAGLYLNCSFATIANLAVSGSEIQPPATIEMSGPTSLTAASTVPIRLTVKNGLPNEITNVIVTDLMPTGLVALEVKAAAVDESNAQIVDAGEDGQLVVVYLDKLAAGAETNIFITVTAAAEIPANTPITNQATLFYRESVAAQASLDLTVSGSSIPIPAAVVREGEAEEAAAVETEAEETADEAFVPPGQAPTTGGELAPAAAAAEAESEQGFIEPDDMPTTGGEITLVEADSLPGPQIADEPLIVQDLAEVAVGNDDPALAETGNQAEQIAATTQPSPVTFVSALLLLAVLIGLGGFSFSARHARLIDENQK